MENNKEIQGWSWLGFLFMPYYYAGYGALKKGLVVAVVTGALGEFTSELMQEQTSMLVLVIATLLGFSIAIYGGIQAKKELPVKKQKFSWLNVFYAFVAYVVGILLVTLMFMLPTSSTPSCNDEQTKQLVKQITFGELKKQGMSKMNIELSSIRTSAYDKEIDKYECAAELSASSETTDYTYNGSIIYTSQATEDNGHFYVEVFGL